MRKENFILTLLIAFLVFGCGAPPLPPSLPVETPTLTFPTLTSSPQPSATEVSPTAPAKPPTPTLTPETDLQTNGPYFAYFQVSNLIIRLVFLDADGRGRKVIELPKSISDSYAYGTLPAPNMRLVSPDGKWMAFYTGSAGKYGEMPDQGDSDLTLSLLNLATGEKQVVTPLLSKDYPNNFVEAAKTLNDPYITAESLHDAFIEGITQAIGWSPNGRYLAFAGQMDGLSSDLYVYDVNTQKIQRLSSGDQELQWISWSPDGKWILHSGVYLMGLGTTFDIYAAALDGSTVQYVSTNILFDGIHDWLNAHQYFENDGENGPGEYGLRVVDIETGGIIRVWDGSFYSYAVTKNGTWVLLLAASPDKSPLNGSDFDFVPGLYLINLKTREKTRVIATDNGHDYGEIESFGLAGREFVLTDQTTDNSIFLGVDGKLTETDLGAAKISVLPNSEYWLAITAQNAKIFSADDTLIKDIPFSFSIGPINDIVWRPDSSGAFLISGSELYSMDILNGDIQIVETDLLTDSYALLYKWISGQ